MKFTPTLLLVLLSTALPSTEPPGGTKERIKVYSHAIEGNLIGDSPERDVTVYLPPSYHSEPDRRYPVLYMLHGFTNTDSQWFGWEEHWINLHAVLDSAIASGQSQEMIVVMPNAYNRFKGSMYSSSVTIGDWETFVSKELVDHIDSHYRSIPESGSRGLAGHSMGGYGTIRLGMKFPEVWSSIYLLSPCCLESTLPFAGEEFKQNIAAFNSPELLDEAAFFEIALLATAAAWAPNPQHPPLYLDVPWEDGELRPEIAGKFTANHTLYIIDQYVHNLRQLKAIGLDVGIYDFGMSGPTKTLHEILESYDIPHVFETYEGDHVNRIAERMGTKVLPFFSEHLEAN